MEKGEAQDVFDGHSGSRTNLIDEEETTYFSLKLSCLLTLRGNSALVIHVSKRKMENRDPDNRWIFLKKIGFSNYFGHCIYWGRGCHCKVLAQTPYKNHFFNQHWAGELVGNFKLWCKRIDEVYGLFCRQQKLLEELHTESTLEDFFASPEEVAKHISNPPSWINEVKFSTLKSLEQEVKVLTAKIEYLFKFLPLLYETGETLENAVSEALRFIGFNVEDTEPGYTVDLIAKHEEFKTNLGIEVQVLMEQ